MTESSRKVVLAISRQLGSGGAALGQSVARQLQLRYADRDILHQAALRLHVDDSDVAPLEERVETFWEHLAPLFLFGVTGGPMTPPLPPSVTGSALFNIESEIIQSLAARENAVIVGRGAAHVLRGRPGLVTVFLHASEAFRVARLVERLDEPEHSQALEMVRRSDRQRAEFNRSITGRDWIDATQYDVCIDTSTVGLEKATGIVTELVAGYLRQERSVGV